MTLQRALLGLIVLVLALAVVPAGAIVQRRLATALEDRTRQDLSLAIRVLDDRWSSGASVRMMHAKELASVAGLGPALARGDLRQAEAVVDATPLAPLEEPVLVDAQGRSRTGPPPPASLLDATRVGEMPVAVVVEEERLTVMALAPIMVDGAWQGAAGVVTPLDEGEASTLSGLTRADVVLVRPDGQVAASTLDPGLSPAVARALTDHPEAEVQDITVGSRRLVAARGDLAGVATAIFVRDLEEELAVLPALRTAAAVSIGLASLLALVAGALVAMLLARPVDGLARDADRFASGDLSAPVRANGVREVRRVAEALDVMRQRLDGRVTQLEEANRELEDRQQRLGLLQAELVQRDRLAAAGRLLAQLAHEIRNPVATVRNCLELLRRRVENDPEAREFADMAIDELLGMHELAEQMMDLHRPKDAESQVADPVEVADRVARLVRVGATEGAPDIHVSGGAGPVRMAPETLKQVLLNVVQNASEAAGPDGEVRIGVAEVGDDVRIDVTDDGPGVPAAMADRVFDPFFTTKDAVRGVGLGLFQAEGLVRTAGGRIALVGEGGARGAHFRIELPGAVERAVQPGAMAGS